MPSFGSSSTAEQVLRDFDLSGKNVLVTGVTFGGIGYETALQIAKHKATVYASGRSEKAANEAVEKLKKESGSDKIHPVVIDLGEMATIKKAVEGLQGIKFDILLFNAGVISNNRLTTKDGFELIFGVNHLGHFLLGNLLINQLNDNARVVCTSSNAAKVFIRDGGIMWDDLMWEKTSFAFMKVYAQSKLANIYFAYELNRLFKERGIKASAYSLHPGAIATGLSREGGKVVQAIYAGLMKIFGKSIAQGAATQVYVATSPEINPETDGGKWFEDCRIATPPKYAQEPLIQSESKKLWEVSLKLVGLEQSQQHHEHQSKEEAKPQEQQ